MVGVGVFAVPCSGTTTSAEGGGEEAVTQPVNVTQEAALDLTNMFNCEGGDFEVYWSGEVNVSATITIGAGTTVRIFGEGNSTEGNSSLSDNEALEELTSELALPVRLTSAAVGVGPPNITVSTEEDISFGPMFYVEGGQLFLEDMIVRGGFAANTTTTTTSVNGSGSDGTSLDGIGGGVFAVNSNVTVTRCEFNDNFAENLGGGIFANQSTLVVVDSMFRYCEAGFFSTIEDDVDNGAGGGISVSSPINPPRCRI